MPSDYVLLCRSVNKPWGGPTSSTATPWSVSHLLPLRRRSVSVQLRLSVGNPSFLVIVREQCFLVGALSGTDFGGLSFVLCRGG